MIFTIDTENNITAFASQENERAQNNTPFRNQKDLAKLAADWPAERLVEIWNSLPGGKPVKKFTSRNTAVGRIWKAIQSLGPDGGADTPQKPRTKASKGTQAARKVKPAPARDGSKKATVIEMLRRKDGANLDDIIKATGWQAHSVRGFISGALIKKAGLKVESFKRPDGERAYAIRG
jgi:hypothetical protein